MSNRLPLGVLPLGAWTEAYLLMQLDGLPRTSGRAAKVSAALEEIRALRAALALARGEPVDRAPPPNASDQPCASPCPWPS